MTLNEGYIRVIQSVKRCFRFKTPSSSEFPRNIPRSFRGDPYVRRHFLGIYRGDSEEKESIIKSPSPRNFLGIFRGNADEHKEFLGISSEFSEGIPRNLGFSIEKIYSEEIPRKTYLSSEFPRYLY